MRRADTNAVGPGGYGNASMASGWGKITLATLVVVGLLLGAFFVFWTPSGVSGPEVLRLFRREQVDAKSPVSPSQQQPEPLAPGNVIGKPGGHGARSAARRTRRAAPASGRRAATPAPDPPAPARPASALNWDRRARASTGAGGAQPAGCAPPPRFQRGFLATEWAPPPLAP